MNLGEGLKFSLNHRILLSNAVSLCICLFIKTHIYDLYIQYLKLH